MGVLDTTPAAEHCHLHTPAGLLWLKPRRWWEMFQRKKQRDTVTVRKDQRPLTMALWTEMGKREGTEVC